MPFSQAEPRATLVPAVGAVVVDSTARVLLVQRGRPPSVGSWTLPGGRLEPDESFEEAVTREVREETGLDVRVVGELCRVEIAREGFAFLVHEYLAVPLAPTPVRAGDDAADARWVRADEMPALGVRRDAVAVIDQGIAEAVARGLARR